MRAANRLNAVKNFIISWKDNFVPFLSWLPELKNPSVLKADIIAGVTVALVLVPQSMAYAQLAGLPPYHGLYASFLPGMIAAFFGSSRQLATGPVAVVSLMTASALEPIAGHSPEAYIAYAVMLALMVGIFQLALGLLRMGVLVNFLSHPVVVGFTNAAAIIIATSQIGKLFGVSVPKAEHHYETVWNTLAAAVDDTHLATLGMGLLALAIMIGLKRFAPKWPNVLVAVVVTTLVAWITEFEKAGGRVVGSIPDGLPPLSLPTIDWAVAQELITVAVAISLIGFMEAVSIAKAMAAQTRQRLDANQELVGQGLSNMLASFSQGYAVSGSFSRSAVNISAGAVTGFSSIVTGLVVGVTLLWLTPLLYNLPVATLAAVIIMAVINLVKVAPITHAWHVQKHDGVVAITTFILTLLLAPHVENGIIAGLLLSLGLYLYRTMKPRIVVLARHTDGTLRDAEVNLLRPCSKISIIRFDGSLYFANTGYFEDKVLERSSVKKGLQYIIIDAEAINSIDATGEEMLHSLAERLKTNGIELLFARTKKQIMDVFRKTGFVDTIGEDHFFRLRTHAMHYAFANMNACDAEYCCPLQMHVPVDEELQEEKRLKEAAKAEKGVVVETFE